MRFAFALLALFALAGASVTQEQLNNDYFWYCEAWQNGHGTTVPSDGIYSLAQLSQDGANFVISSWNGDAAQPSNSDLLSLNTSDADLVKWQYPTLTAVLNAKPFAMTTTQRGQMIGLTAGML